jgi:hopanoid biosynthesis associated RND transporter like protein HpnN
MTAGRATRIRFRSGLVAWVDAMTRHAVWVLLVAAILTTMAGVYTAHHLGVNTDIVDMFSPDLPFRRTEAAYRARFPHELDTLLLVIDGPTPELVAEAGRDLTERLAAETDLFEEVYQPRRSRFLDEHALLYLDMDELEDLADHLAEAQPFLGRLAHDFSLRGFCEVLVDALQAEESEAWSTGLEPLLRDAKVAFDGTLEGRPHDLSWQELIEGEESTAEQQLTIVVARPRLDYRSLLPAARAIDRIRKVAAARHVDAAHALRLRITGTVALRHDELETMGRGAGLATALAFALVSLILYAGLRSVRLMVACLVTLVVGLAWTGWFAALTVGHVNLISIAFGVLYIGLGIDHAIHYCLRYQELAARGLPRREALATAAGDVGVSVVLCAATTCIAFYAFVPTSFRGVSELGLIAGTGMLLSIAANLTVLPALVSRIGAPDRAARARSWPRLRDWPLRHATLVRVAALLLVLAALPLAGRVRFDPDPLNLRDPDSESVSTLRDLLSRPETSPWYIVVLADERSLAEERERLAALDVVDRVVAIDDFVPDGQDEKLAVIDDLALMVSADTWLPVRRVSVDDPDQLAALRAVVAALDDAGRRQAALAGAAAALRASIVALLQRADEATEAHRHALLLRLEAALLGALPPTLRQIESGLRAGPVSLDSLPDDLVRRWRSDDGVYRLVVFPVRDMRDAEALREFAAAVRAVAPDATGAPVIHVAAADAVIASFRQALVTAFIAIGILLLIVLGSPRDAVLALVPVLLAGLLLGAAATLANIPFNFANVIAVPLLLGMGVDGGIHMVRRSRAATHDTNVLATSTTRAVLYSALTTIAGFGALALSPHPGLASLGRLLTLGILFVLLGTLVVLPTLLGGNKRVESRK